MTTAPSPIAGFEDWPAYVRASPLHQGHNDDSRRLASALGVPALPSTHPEIVWGSGWVVDGVQVTQLQWRLPYGPPTTAYLLVPENHREPLPAVLWNQCHAGNKWLGSERLVDIGPETPEGVSVLQRALYDGHAVANEVARAGFAVLVHDAFSWGSRKFTLDPAPRRTADWVEARMAQWAEQHIVPSAEMLYNAAAAHHENTIAKASGLLGTSYAGMVAHEDLIALAILRSLPMVDAERIGTAGFSGGGGRSLALAALAPDVRACVISCMMTTFAGLFPDHLDHHSWLLNTPGLAHAFDLPELTTLNSGCSFLVQFADTDPLFSRTGMRDADGMLQRLHAQDTDQYTGAWYDEGHVFSSALRNDAVGFLQRKLQQTSSLQKG